MAADRATAALTIAAVGLSLQLFSTALPPLADVAAQPDSAALAHGQHLAVVQAAAVVTVVGLALGSLEVLLVGAVVVAGYSALFSSARKAGTA